MITCKLLDKSKYSPATCIIRDSDKKLLPLKVISMEVKTVVNTVTITFPIEDLEIGEEAGVGYVRFKFSEPPPLVVQ